MGAVFIIPEHRSNAVDLGDAQSLEREKKIKYFFTSKRKKIDKKIVSLIVHSSIPRLTGQSSSVISSNDFWAF